MGTPAERHSTPIRLPGTGPYFTGRFGWAGYGLALLLTASVAFGRLALVPLVGNEAPLLPFVLVVVAAGYLGGHGPGIAAVVASAFTAHILFANISAPDHRTVAWTAHLALFTIVGVLVTEGIHRMQRSAAALYNSERRLRDILDRASAVVFFKDRDGRYLFVNDEFLRIFGLERRDVIGRSEHELFAPGIAQAMREHDGRVWLSGMPLTAEEVVQQVEGLHTYVATKFLLRDATGTPYALCGIATDITDQKLTEEALREADLRKDIFLATLSHELRNPLAPIRHAAHLLRTPGITAANAERARDIIERQSQHMTRLLDDLMDVSRITRGRLELRKHTITARSVVDSALEAVRPLLESRNHHVTVDVPEEPIYLYADEVRLSQVIANLLTNAAKYTPPGGFIQIRVQREAGDVALRVIDNGIGIAPEALPRIFEMFSRGRSEREHAEGGLGIGLALVRGLLELHGGTVEARSDGPDRGSEFIVRVPADEAATQSATHRASLSAPGTHTGCRILIVDDNRDAADSLQLLLQQDGYTVLAAYDGRSALLLAQEFHPGVVLLDIGMPGLNGYEVAEQMRAQRWGQEATLIALTGWGQAQDRARAQAAGFDHHVTKPVEPERLRALLAESCGLAT